MKGAAAALAGAVLFFLGVLTAASDGGRVPTPAAIPLGVEPVVSSSRTPATPAAEKPGTPAPAAPQADGEPAGDPTIPAGAPGSGDLSSTPAAGEEPPAGDSNGVEEVGGRVDCVEVGGQTDGGSSGGQVDSGQNSGPPGGGDATSDECPPGQAKKAGDGPKDQKGAGDGR